MNQRHAYRMRGIAAVARRPARPITVRTTVGQTATRLLVLSRSSLSLAPCAGARLLPALVLGAGFPLVSSAALAVSAVGDSGTVTIDEILKAVNVALGELPLDQCPAGDCNAAGQVAVDCIIKAVAAALHGCAPTATSSPTHTGTATATTSPTSTATRTASMTPASTGAPTRTPTATASNTRSATGTSSSAT
jgi:hypothetical protein